MAVTEIVEAKISDAISNQSDYIRGLMSKAVEECCGDALALGNSFREIKQQISSFKELESMSEDQANNLLTLIDDMCSFLPHPKD